MLTYLTRNKLADFLLAVNEGERQIEIIRQILCEQEQFEPYAAFKRIDRLKKGSINALDILNFLEDNKIYHSERHCHIFIQRYDVDGDGQLVYSEFLQGVLTLDNPTLRTVTTQRPVYEVGQYDFLPYDVEYALSKVIDREVTFYLDLDAQKQQLLSFHDFNYPNAFSVIDKYSTGVINYENLRTFFKGQAIYPGDEEVIAILRRLDKNDDGLITYEEFVEAIEPVSDILKATANRRNASAKFESPSRARAVANSPVKKEASPLRRTASPTRRIASPLKVNTVFDTKGVSAERKAASPLRRTASPIRKEASPCRKETSPTRKLDFVEKPNTSPCRKTASPLRKTASPYTPTKKSDTLGSAEKGTSLRRSQIYKDFPRSQSKSPLRVSAEGRTSPRKTSGGLSKTMADPQTPEKRPSLRNKQSTGLNSIKKGLSLDNDVNHYLIIQTLKQFIALDKDIEIAKQDVALKSDFNLLDFFRTFDVAGNGTLSCREFEAGLMKYGVYPNKEDLSLLFKKMDVDNDGLLRFSDFAEIFTPKQKEYINLLHNRTPQGTEAGLGIHKVFSQDTKAKATFMLKLHVENEATSESLKLRLKGKCELSGHECFKYLDIRSDNFITSEELVEVFQKSDTFLTDREVRLLMERLDNDKDGKISYYEFLGQITPKCEESF